MDISYLAASTAVFLAPYLIKAAEKAAETVGEKLPKAVAAVWDAVFSRFCGKSAAEEAAADFAVQPDDEDNLASFRKHLREVLEADQAFASELSQLLESAKNTTANITNTGTGAVASEGGVAAGEGGVAIKGDVHGGIHVGGSNNKK